LRVPPIVLGDLNRPKMTSIIIKKGYVESLG
jgi:hypothetical protein